MLVVDNNSLVVKSMYFYFNSCCVILLNIASSFHVDHKLVDFVPVGESEYDEVIEEEIFAQEDAQEPVGADPTDPAPAQGKPRCITPIFK